VTVGEFRRFVEETGYKGNGINYWGCAGMADPNFSQDDNHPVVCVSWNEAKAFAKWLSKKTGHKFRLPTEAEWEYACRNGGKEIKYATSTGDLSHDLADYWGKGGRDKWEYTAPVGSFPPNVGIYDMCGNVWEWCEDWYDKNYYGRSPKNDPQGPKNGKYRVLRGSSWNGGPWIMRCALRSGYVPGSREDDVGFRLVRLSGQ